MKLFKQIIISLIIISFINLSSCASHKKINKKVSKIKCTEKFHFSLDKSSELVKITYVGDHVGKSKTPNYQSTFKNAIQELKASSKIKMEYKDVLGFPSDSITNVNVEIKSILWIFKETHMIMETELVYKLPDTIISTLGTNKVILAGSKTGNLMKSIKDGTYRFLLEYCDH